MAISSGGTFGVASVTTIRSDSIITLAAEVSSANLSVNFVVQTISDSTHFRVGYANGAAIPADVTVHWMIINTKEG